MPRHGPLPDSHPQCDEKAASTWWTPNPLGNVTFPWAGGVSGAFPLWSVRAKAFLMLREGPQG